MFVCRTRKASVEERKLNNNLQNVKSKAKTKTKLYYKCMYVYEK